ncbi:unnamed protein product, partial [Durusdinium trenchii]
EWVRFGVPWSKALSVGSLVLRFTAVMMTPLFFCADQRFEVEQRGEYGDGLFPEVNAVEAGFAALAIVQFPAIHAFVYYVKDPQTSEPLMRKPGRTVGRWPAWVRRPVQWASDFSLVNWEPTSGVLMSSYVLLPVIPCVTFGPSCPSFIAMEISLALVFLYEENIIDTMYISNRITSALSTAVLFFSVNAETPRPELGDDVGDDVVVQSWISGGSPLAATLYVLTMFRWLHVGSLVNGVEGKTFAAGTMSFSKLWVRVLIAVTYCAAIVCEMAFQGFVLDQCSSLLPESSLFWIVLLGFLKNATKDVGSISKQVFLLSREMGGWKAIAFPMFVLCEAAAFLILMLWVIEVSIIKEEKDVLCAQLERTKLDGDKVLFTIVFGSYSVLEGIVKTLEFLETVHRGEVMPQSDAGACIDADPPYQGAAADEHPPAHVMRAATDEHPPAHVMRAAADEHPPAQVTRAAADEDRSTTAERTTSTSTSASAATSRNSAPSQGEGGEVEGDADTAKPREETETGAPREWVRFGVPWSKAMSVGSLVLRFTAVMMTPLFVCADHEFNSFRAYGDELFRHWSPTAVGFGLLLTIQGPAVFTLVHFVKKSQKCVPLMRKPGRAVDRFPRWTHRPVRWASTFSAVGWEPTPTILFVAYVMLPTIPCLAFAPTCVGFIAMATCLALVFLYEENIIEAMYISNRITSAMSTAVLFFTVHQNVELGGADELGNNKLSATLYILTMFRWLHFGSLVNGFEGKTFSHAEVSNVKLGIRIVITVTYCAAITCELAIQGFTLDQCGSLFPESTVFWIVLLGFLKNSTKDVGSICGQVAQLSREIGGWKGFTFPIMMLVEATGFLLLMLWIIDQSIVETSSSDMCRRIQSSKPENKALFTIVFGGYSVLEALVKTLEFLETVRRGENPEAR